MAEKEMKEFRCKKCNRTLGLTDGEVLKFRINDYETEVSTKNFPFPCKCNWINWWKGEKKKK